ncbi:MAG TPA: hypothetical protein VME69_11555 [Methylocella sp.]|nr:hypothetical protein [Methylocella sp.]
MGTLGAIRPAVSRRKISFSVEIAAGVWRPVRILPVSGLPAWLIWRAYDLSQMPTFGRKLRIFIEWTWGMFFPTDITHFRFTWSGDTVGRSDEELGHRLRTPRDATGGG